MTHRFSSDIRKLLLRLSTTAVVAAAATTLLLPSPASAQDTPLNFSGTIQVGGQTLTANNGAVITSGSSGISFAHIAGPEEPHAGNNFKGCPDFHLHGTVNGQFDPDPSGCGWGIINFLGAPPPPPPTNGGGNLPPFFDHPHTFGEHLVNVFPAYPYPYGPVGANELLNEAGTDDLVEYVWGPEWGLEGGGTARLAKLSFKRVLEKLKSLPPGDVQEGSIMQGPILLFNPDGSLQLPTLQLPILVDHSLFAPHPPFPGSNLTFPIGDTPIGDTSPGGTPPGDTPPTPAGGGVQPTSSPWSEINDELTRLAEMARGLDSLKRRAARATGDFKIEADNEVRRYERDVNDQNRKVINMIQQQIQSTINAINAANAASNTPQPTPR